MRPKISEKPDHYLAGDEKAMLVGAAAYRSLDEKNQKIADVMRAVKSVYFETANDMIVDIPLQRMKRALGTSDPNAFAVAICGESGMGKSTLIGQRLKDEEAFQPVPDGYGNDLHPVLYVTVPSDATMIDLGEKILDVAGYPTRRRKRESELVRDVVSVLRRLGTRIVILDEFQHVLDAPKVKGPAHIADSIKNLLQDKRWPVFIVLMGLPEVKDVVFRDPKDQLLRRVDDFSLQELSFKTDAEFVARVIKELVEKRAGLRMPEDRVADFVERLMFGAHYRFGLILETIYHAIEDALEAEQEEVDMTSWEEGYRRLVNGDNDPKTNVFAADAWRLIIRPINRRGEFGPASLKTA